MSPPKQVPRHPSRNVAMAAVVVLVVIAVAGVVMATRRQSAPLQPTTQESTAEMTAASEPAAASGPQPARPESPSKYVQFDESSDELPSGAEDKLARFAATVKAQKKGAYLDVLVASGEHHEADMAMARKRLEAVRRVLLAHGLSVDNVHPQITQVRAGLITVSRGARLELSIL